VKDSDLASTVNSFPKHNAENRLQTSLDAIRNGGYGGFMVTTHHCGSSQKQADREPYGGLLG
jgi:hypothetical protein